MTIKAAQVKELREKTGVGMMECKKALVENDGDLEKAILWLREKGLSRAAKKAGRVTAEGIVEVFIDNDSGKGTLLEVNCETDFVSKNEDFIAFVKKAAKIALENDVNDVETLKNLPFSADETTDQTLKNLIAKIGENLNVRRVKTIMAEDGVVAGYSHMGGKIGTLVAFEGAGTSDETKELARNIAMHVAAASPRYLRSEDVDPGELEQEKELARKKLLEQKKPENMIDKIIIGQMNKFYKEVCLLEQSYVKEPDLSIKKLVAKAAPKASLTNYARFQLGEGIEKKKEDFAAEVAKAQKTT